MKPLLPLAGAVSALASAVIWVGTYNESSDAAEAAPRPPECANGYVRLTFDDGPDPEVTPLILDTLRDKKATATFFVVGQEVEKHPELVKRMHAEGHQVENHTWSHPNMKEISDDQVLEEFRRTGELIAQLTGVRPDEWRAPYEEYTAKHTEMLKTELGLTYGAYQYDTDTNDWRAESTPASIRERAGNAEDGSVILAHDNQDKTAVALPGIINDLRSNKLCVR